MPLGLDKMGLWCYPICMETKTRHDGTCGRVFGRYDMACSRCRELAAGAPARKGWGPSRAQMDARASAEVAAHFSGARHTSGGCGVVCTFGEW